MSNTNLTAERLREVLHYDPATGVFVWRCRVNSHVDAGQIAGTKKLKYCIIGLNGAYYRAHRLAWFYHYGEWPKEDIDHIDGNTMNNSIANLRQVTDHGNQQNLRRAQKNNKCRFLGVSLHGKKWRAQIMTNGKRVRVCGFDTPEEAHRMYLELKRKFHPTCTI